MTENTLTQKRDPSIYILKCMAVLLVIWSHLDAVLPNPAWSTGGAFGDGLFLFCSGFTLFLSKNGGGKFANWYKRRINRIYPTVFAWALVSCVALGSERNIVDILLHGGGWFVTAIMIFYVPLYFVRRYCLSHLKLVLAVGGLFVLVAYVTIFDYSKVMMYKSIEDFCWCHYSLCMLLGAVCGLRYKANPTATRLLPSAAMALAFAAVYFGWLWCCARYETLAPWQILSLLPFWGFIISVWRMSRSRELLRLYQIKAVARPVYWISALCLDAYLCQFAIIGVWPSAGFPVNVVALFVVIFAVAYINKVLANVFAQTFRDADYDWPLAVKL